MKNKNFEEIITTIKENNSNQINAVWQEAISEKKRNNKTTIITCIIVDIIIFYFISTSIKSFFSKSDIEVMNIVMFFIMFVFIDFIIYFLINIIFNKKQIQYKQIFKEVIIKELINNFYDNVEYLCSKEMPKQIYEEPKYGEDYNRYESEDYFEGQIGNKHSIQMAEIKTKKVEKYRDSKGNTHTRTTIIFHGIFSKIQTDKSINSELKIQRNGRYFFNRRRLEMDSRRV